MLDRLIDLVIDAAKPTERQSDRDGFLSYAIEVHALAIGAGVGFTAVTTGTPQLAAGVISVALGLNRGRVQLNPTVTADIRREPAYFIGGLGLGASVAVLVGLGSFPF